MRSKLRIRSRAVCLMLALAVVFLTAAGQITDAQAASKAVTQAASKTVKQTASKNKKVVLKGFVKKNGRTYYYQKGERVTGEKKIGKYWYLFNENGVMQRGFHDVPGKKKICYYDKNGRRIHGKKTIRGDVCVFNSKTGKLESRIADITYMGQARGILINGQWTHREIVSARSYTYYRLAACGCGLCAAAMAISAKTGRLVLPTRFNSPRYDFTGTTYKTMFSVKCAKAFGLQGKVTTMTRRQLIDHMLRGRMVIVWVKRSIYGGGGNTRGGDTGATGHTHWILIHGYKNGKFAVADSNNRSQSYVTSGNLKSWFTFNSHLGAGKKRSYTVISWNKWWE